MRRCIPARGQKLIITNNVASRCLKMPDYILPFGTALTVYCVEASHTIFSRPSISPISSIPPHYLSSSPSILIDPDRTNTTRTNRHPSPCWITTFLLT
ncbi:hypothetical protein ACN38_g5590 [Penicillium nordicum]|uniref:Uncharacterized protein n=1 Tax=Penicillium nordicum TaxID=229535 RepID=A0A0M8P1Z9_9EURO|nr:hypothetical protein ACN38_g5590 [Penicillium nordicum]